MSLMLIGATPNIIGAGRKAADRLVLVDRCPDNLNEVLRSPQDEFYTLDYRDPARVEHFGALLRRAIRPDAVVSLTEHGLAPAAILTELMGTPGTPRHVVDATQDKWRMRAILAAAVPDLTVNAVAASDHRGVERVLAEWGRAILKPSVGTGSAGVTGFSTMTEFVRLTAGIMSHAQVEPALEGVEISVETLSRSGEHEVIGIAEKRVGPGFVEVAHVMPAPSLTGCQVQSVQSGVSRTLDALGLENGPAHTEMFVKGDAVTILETHNRPGGDGIADLVEVTTGLDWRLASVGWPLGIRPEAGPPRASAAAMVFFTAAPGTVTAIVDTPPSVPGVTIDFWRHYIEPGDRVGPLNSSRDRLGVAKLTGDSPVACATAVERILSTPNVITTEVPA